MHIICQILGHIGRNGLNTSYSESIAELQTNGTHKGNGFGHIHTAK